MKLGTVEREGEVTVMTESPREALEKHKAKVSGHVEALETLLKLRSPESTHLALGAAKEGLHLLATGEKVGGTYFATIEYTSTMRSEYERGGIMPEPLTRVHVKHYVKGSRVCLVPEEISSVAREMLLKKEQPEKIVKSALDLMRAYIK
jgi:hypothetical protein